MAKLEVVEPVVRFCAVISRHPSAIDWAIDKLVLDWGGVVIRSEPLPFDASRFYEPTMGDHLTKHLVAFSQIVDPGGLADWKLQTNAWEDEYTQALEHDEMRPLNLDPGYISQAKLVLATTKDRDHRLYLRDGIFAEVTLTYTNKHWSHHRWTYPDYRTDAVADFAQQCRDRLRDHLKETGQFRQRNN